jgi:hypothetical protein
MKIMITITNKGENTSLLSQVVDPPKDEIEEIVALLFTMTGQVGSAMFRAQHNRELGTLLRRGIELDPTLVPSVITFTDFLRRNHNRKGKDKSEGGLPKFSLN